MKKYIILAIASAFALPAFASTSLNAIVAPAPAASTVTTSLTVTVPPTPVQMFSTTLQKGATASDVTTLQTILKTDPSIYPSGLITGYYGSATEAAVKKLQLKYGLPQTGIVDSATQAILYPNPSTTKIDIAVVSPNGGESWTVGSSQQILWKSSISPIVPTPTPVPVPMMNSAVSGGSVAVASSPILAKPASIVRPFFPYASIDLIRDSQPSYSYHIGSASLYQTQYSWNLPKNIPEASDYRVRISIGKNVPCLYQSDVEAKQSGTTIAEPACATFAATTFASDESDNPFTISGGASSDVAQMKDQIAQIKAMIEKLNAQIADIEAKLENR
jgi:hypothetical protein